MVERLLQLTPVQFEEVVAELLENRGYRDVELVGGANDQGIDITCVDPAGRSTVVQCKRYAAKRTIGSPLIQHFFGMIVHAGAERGIFVTTSTFSTPARRLAEEREIDLIDGKELSNSDLERSVFARVGGDVPTPIGSQVAKPTEFHSHPEYRGRSFESVFEELRLRFGRDQERVRGIEAGVQGCSITDAERLALDGHDEEWQQFGGGWSVDG